MFPAYVDAATGSPGEAELGGAEVEDFLEKQSLEPGCADLTEVFPASVETAAGSQGEAELGGAEVIEGLL